MMPTPLCDGCWMPMSGNDLAIFVANGIQVRYCKDCAAVWVSFKAACDAEGARLQRLLDLFEEDARTRVALYVTPLDFPKPALDAAGNAVILR